MSVPEDHFSFCSSSEGNGIGAADRNYTCGVCCNHDYSSSQFLCFFGGDFEQFEASKTQGSSGGEYLRILCYNLGIL